MSIYVSDVLNIAAGEIGYIEKASNKDLDSQTGNPGTGNWTKYARDLWAAEPHYYQAPKNGYDWCTVFVDWCVYMASGQDSVAAQKAMCYTGPYGASCTFSVNYYKAVGRFWVRQQAQPKPGDQIFFGTADNIRHTGLVEKVTEDGVVYTIEGNSANQVRRLAYALTDGNIYGYGRPRYDGDSPPVKAPEPEEPVEDPEEQPVTGPIFTDTEEGRFYSKALKWAAANGITKGTGDGKFEPDKACTRAQVVTFLYRLYNLIEGGEDGET